MKTTISLEYFSKESVMLKYFSVQLFEFLISLWFNVAHLNNCVNVTT